MSVTMFNLASLFETAPPSRSRARSARRADLGGPIDLDAFRFAGHDTDRGLGMHPGSLGASGKASGILPLPQRTGDIHS